VGFLAADGRDEQVRVDISARQHDDRRSGAAAGGDRSAQHGGDTDRASTLDHELRPFHEQHHRIGDLVLSNHDHLVDILGNKGQRERPGPAHRDAVGQGADGLYLDGMPRRQRCRERGDAGRLHGDDAHRRSERLHRTPHASREATSSERNDHERYVLNILDQLEAE
jgi:hypothetical protein